MAEIKVTKKSAVPWWAWLLLAVVAVALIWWAIATLGDDEESTAQTAPAVPAEQAAPAAAGDVITDVSTLLAANDPAALIGRQVRLDGVQIQEMVGDATFWIGPSADQRVFVVLNEQIPSSPSDVEGRVNVNAGQTVDLQGSLRAADDLPAGVLDDAGKRQVADRRIYIWAQTAEVASRP